MVTNPKATIISVYFGKLPYYFEFTKKTIQHNKNFQWIIAGDMFPEKVEDGNILFLPYTLKDLSEGCSQVLNTKIDIKTPYKTCDVRPLFASIFEKYISSDWVGWADLDCIFGELDYFVTEAVLKEYDIFTYLATSVYNVGYPTPHGPFTLYNNKTLKNWFLKIENLSEKLNYSDDNNGDLRASSKFLDETEFGRVIRDENYKVCTKYKPYENRDIELPIVFNGRRRAPAKWESGKIWVDSVAEDYDGRFPGLHSMFLHIRSGFTVDIVNNTVLPKEYGYYLNHGLNVTVSKSKSCHQFIKSEILTLKYLITKITDYKVDILKSIFTDELSAIINTLIPELNYNIVDTKSSDSIVFDKFLHLTHISPTIIEDFNSKLKDNCCPKSVFLYKDGYDVNLEEYIKKLHLTVINIADIDAVTLCKVFANSDIIVSQNLTTELELLILCKPNVEVIEIGDTDSTYKNIFKQLSSITAKKRKHVNKTVSSLLHAFEESKMNGITVNVQGDELNNNTSDIIKTLDNVYIKSRAGIQSFERIAYLGGSISSSHLTPWHRNLKQYLTTKNVTVVDEKNYSIGGVGAFFSVFRLHEIIKNNPTVVFIEFTVNEICSKSNVIHETLGTIISFFAQKNVDCCIIHNYHTCFQTDFDALRTPKCIDCIEQLAQETNVPSINFAQFYGDLLREHKIETKDFLGDSCHLNESAYTFFEQFYDTHDLLQVTKTGKPQTFLKEYENIEPLKHNLLSSNLEYINIIDTPLLADSRIVSLVKRETTEFFRWNEEKEIVFTFSGKWLFIHDIIGPTSGTVKVVVNDAFVKMIPRFDSYCSDMFRHHFFAINCNTPGIHTIKLTLLKEHQKQEILNKRNKQFKDAKDHDITESFIVSVYSL